MEKRIKTKNFTNTERNMLLAFIKSNKPLIESKVSSAIMIKRKAEAWEEVKNYFNALAETPRSVKQLKTLYENIKRKARKARKTVVEQNNKICENIIKIEADDSEDEIKTDIFYSEEESELEKIKVYESENDENKCKEISGNSQQIRAILGNQIAADTNPYDSSSQYHGESISGPPDCEFHPQPEPEPIYEPEPTSVLKRTRKKKNNCIINEQIKRRYLVQKLRNAQFEARAQRLNLHWDLKIKRKQFELLDRE